MVVWCVLSDIDCYVLTGVWWCLLSDIDCYVLTGVWWCGVYCLI